MAKILKIDDNTVIIGMDDHTTIKVEKSDFPFEIKEMMFIEAYKYDDKYLFSLPDVATNSVKKESTHGKIYVKKRPYVLWYFFIGELGIHEFYAGNKLKGATFLGATILLCLLVHFGTGPNFSYDGYSYVETPSVGGMIIQTIRILYFILIRVLSIVAMNKQSNEEGKILIYKC